MNKYVTNLTLPNGTNILIKDLEGRTNLSNEIIRATAKETELEESYTHLQNDLTTETNAREQGDNKNNAEISKIHSNITGIKNKNTEQDNEISTLRTMISSPYNFKGDVASISELPASGEVNDTYYVQDVKYKVTWTGSAWVQSSLSEADYQTELSELKSDLVNVNSSIGNNIIPIQHYINNKIVDGSGYHDADGWIATENFISVDGISKLITNVEAIFYVVYNADMTVIDNGTLSLHARVVRDGYIEYHFSSNAKYIKFSIDKTALDSNSYISFNTYERINDFAIKSTSDYIDNNILKNVAWLNGYYIQGDGLHQNDEYKTSDYVYCHGQSVIKLNSSAFYVTYDKNGRTVLNNGVSNEITVNRAYSVRFSTTANQNLIASFGDYNNNLLDRTKIYVGKGKGYTNLLQAIRDAHSKGKCDIYVSSGTYNVLEELTEMGVDITQNGYEGVFIGNDTNVYAETGATLVCNYEQVSQASYNFSVLNCDDSDFLIENLTIKAKNIRYCVHDDPNTTTKAYTHKFNNCHMEIDNSENEYWKQGTCIGAGLGHKGYVVVDGGYYKGRYLDNLQSTINYHGDSTTGRTDSDCNLVIKNVYFDGLCTCGVTKYGASEILSKAYISNCSMYSDIIFDTKEGETGGWILKAWNNEIRS